MRKRRLLAVEIVVKVGEIGALERGVGLCRDRPCAAQFENMIEPRRNHEFGRKGRTVPGKVRLLNVWGVRVEIANPVPTATEALHVKLSTQIFVTPVQIVDRGVEKIVLVELDICRSLEALDRRLARIEGLATDCRVEQDRDLEVAIIIIEPA